MPNVQCQLPVEADIQTIWKVFLDKVENPSRYMEFVESCTILEDAETHIVREIKTPDMALKEKITVDEKQGEVYFELMDHPFFSGTVTHSIIPPAADLEGGLPVVQVTLNWTATSPEGQALERDNAPVLKESMEAATLHLKQMAEGFEKNQQVT